MHIETQGLKNKVSKTQGLKRCVTQNLMTNFLKILYKRRTGEEKDI
jgi:hypothetical protein